MPEFKTFLPRDDELEWINKNIESWSAFCHDAIYYRQRQNFYDRINKIANRIFLILLGSILLSISYVFPVGLIWIMWFIIGMSMVAFGLGLLFLEVSNDRRCR